METVIYVVVALAVGYAVGRFSLQPRAILQIVVSANAPSSNLGDIHVSKGAGDRIRWTMSGNETFTGAPQLGVTTPTGSPSPYLNPVKTSSTQLDSGPLNPAAKEGDITPYTLPGSTRPYNGRIIIQR